MFRKKIRGLVSVFLVCCLAGSVTANSLNPKPSQYIDTLSSENAFKIVSQGQAASIYVDTRDELGVLRAARDLADDVGKVSGVVAEVNESVKAPKGSILIGTIGSSRIIDKLIADKKIDVSDIKGQWESYLIQTVDGNLVIAGSDRRGTIYGIYDISENIGVSPWYWWADVPVKKSNTLYVKAGRYLQESPKVKYRGIFINDEEPSFGGWARNKFGGINSKMYAHMFELILRLKGNYLWPAMWGKSFNEDDPLNPVVANEYGIVMGTSHHEPMMRSHTEYTSRKDEVGAWNYTENKTNLDKFFTDGLERNKAYDNLITIGMRGDGDVALSEEGDEQNMETLRQVVKGQREIIQNVYGKAPSEVPQMWAIFTEVQRYYDAGLTVPDDVLLLFCDNNWGYIRRKGPEKEKDREGGMGLYYHIDMNGGPWNDRWINTTTIPKLYEQFNLAYRSGLDDLWVINVGDLKPKELPIDFILRYAWNPDAYNPDNLRDYTVNWAANIFGDEHAVEIADIVSKYPKYNLLRKPEVQSTRIFSYVNHHEADSMLGLWQELVEQVETLRPKIKPEAQDAFYQLVYYPAKASAGVAEIYLAAGRNNLYDKQGRVSANDYAQRARDLFELDKQLSAYYNDEMADGKWKNMMSDVHIGYVQWSMPDENRLPRMMEVDPLPTPTMGVAIEGSELAWPGTEAQAVLPTFDVLRKQSYYIDIFNRGTGSFEFEAKSNKPWIKISTDKGTVEKENRLQVEIDWEALPEGNANGIVTVSSGNREVTVDVNALKAPVPETERPFFGGLTGEYSIPANQFNANIPGEEAKWIVLPDLGRSEACMGISPVTASSTMGKDAPHLEYDILLNEKGKATILIGILPTQDVKPERGLRLAVALNENDPVQLDARKGFHDEFQEYTEDNLSRSKSLKPLPEVDRKIALIARGEHRRSEVFDNLRWLDVELDVMDPGIQTLKMYMVDPEIVVEKIVVNPDNNHPSYFGAPVVKTDVSQENEAQSQKPNEFRYTNPITRDSAISMRDHFIIKVGEKWYSTGTSNPIWTGPNPGVRLLESDDLLNWKHHSWLIDASKLPDDCPYNGRFWAPEIHFIQGKYWLTVNSGKVSDDDPSGMATHSVWLFSSDKVTGPYELVNGPLTPQYNNDATLFEDEDGQVYFYCSGNGLFQAKIDLESGKLTTPIQKFLDKNEPGYPEWMTGGIEGPFVLKRDGFYFMFFSTWTRGYEVGLLKSKNPLGPWELVSRETIFGTRKKGYRPELAIGGGYDHLKFSDTQDPYSETGHNALFIGPDGNLWSSCHYLMYEQRPYPYSQTFKSWELMPQMGYEPIYFENGRFYIDGPTWTEQVITY